MSELLDAHAPPRPPSACARASCPPRELFDALPRARGRRGARRLPLGGRRGARARGGRPARRRAARREGPLLRGGRAEHGRLAHPRGLPAALHGHRRSRKLQRRGRADARQDQHGRVRDGLVERELGLRAGEEPVGPRARAGRLERRLGGGGGGRASRPWAIGTDTGGSIRQPAALCGIVGLKPTYGAVSRYGMIAFASSLDQSGPLTRDVTDAALLFRHMVGRDPCDSTSLEFPEEIEAAERRAARRRALRRAARAHRRGHRAGRARGVRGHAEADRGAGRHASRRSRCRTRGHGLSAYYVLAPAEASANLARYDGVRYGLRGGRTATCSRSTRRRAPTGFGAEVKRRIMLGTYALSSGYYEAYYGRAQSVRTKIAEDFRAAFEQVDLVVTPTSPTVAFKLGERTGGPARDVPLRLLHGADAARRHPGHLDPGRAVRGPAGGLPARRPRVQREPASSTPPTRSSRRSASRRGAAVTDAASRRAELRAGHRARDPRAAQDAHEDVLRLRALVRRGAEHPHLPDLPRPSRARCR